MVLDPVSDLLSSRPSKVVPAPAAVTKGWGFSFFSGFCFAMLSSDQIQIRRPCSTWVPRFGSLPIRQVADRGFSTVFRMENVFHVVGDCKSSGIMSSIFYSVDDGSSSDIRILRFLSSFSLFGWKKIQ